MILQNASQLYFFVLLLCLSNNHVTNASHHRRGPPSKGQSIDESNDFSDNKGSYSNKMFGKKGKKTESLSNAKGGDGKWTSPSASAKGNSKGTLPPPSGKGNSKGSPISKGGKGASSKGDRPVDLNYPTDSPVYISPFPTPLIIYDPTVVRTVKLHKFTIQYDLKDGNNNRQPDFNDYGGVVRATEQYLDILVQQHFDQLYDVDFIELRVGSTSWSGLPPYKIQYGTEADFQVPGTLPSSAELDLLVVDIIGREDLYVGFLQHKLGQDNEFVSLAKTMMVSNKIFQKSVRTDLYKLLSHETSTTVLDFDSTRSILLPLCLVIGNIAMLITIYVYITNRRKAQPPVKHVWTDSLAQSDEISLVTDVES